MSTIPRHVIIDLLPLYLAGELSADTNILVEQYLRADPDLAAKVKLAESDPPPRASMPGSRSDPEIAAIQRTRSMLALQRWLFGLAFGFTAIGLSVSASLGRSGVRNVHFMLTEFPAQLGACLVAGGICWALYYRLRRRFRT